MTKKYLELTPEDLAKVNRTRAKEESVKIDPEQLFIAEFGKMYGYEGMKAILSNEIDGDTAAWMVTAGRKVEARMFVDHARAVLIGAGAAQSKKPSQVFKKATSEETHNMKADI